MFLAYHFHSICNQGIHGTSTLVWVAHSYLDASKLNSQFLHHKVHYFLGKPLLTPHGISSDLEVELHYAIGSLYVKC